MKNIKLLENTKKWINDHKKEMLGGALLVAGFVLIWFSKEIILNMIFFVGGAILLYIGFVLLNLTSVTHFIDRQVNRIIKKR